MSIRTWQVSRSFQVNNHAGRPCISILKIPAKSLLTLEIKSGLILATVLLEFAITFPSGIYFGDVNTDLKSSFVLLPSRYIWYIELISVLSFPLFSGFIFLLLSLTRRNNGILWRLHRFWIWGQPFTSEEKGSLIESKGYFWFIHSSFPSGSYWLPSDWSLCSSPEPTVRWLASAAQLFSNIFQGQTPSLSCNDCLVWGLYSDEFSFFIASVDSKFVMI